MAHEIIDLGKLKDREDYQHIWSMLYTFRVDDEVVDKIMKNLKLEPSQREVIPVIPDGDHFVGMEGPGCLKCRIRVEAGYGELCEVSTKQFYATRN